MAGEHFLRGVIEQIGGRRRGAFHGGIIPQVKRQISESASQRMCGQCPFLSVYPLRRRHPLTALIRLPAVLGALLSFVAMPDPVRTNAARVA